MPSADQHNSHFAIGAIRALARLIGGALSLLADAPDPSSEEGIHYSAMRGGDFNHRTAEFDDGTDPAGWYQS